MTAHITRNNPIIIIMNINDDANNSKRYMHDINII